MDAEVQAAAAAEAGAEAGAEPAAEAGAEAAPASAASSVRGGGSGSLPPGLSSSGRLASAASDLGSPSAEAAAAAAAAAASASVYVSAAPSVQLEPAGSSGDADVAVLLEPAGDGSVQLSILLPAAEEGAGQGPGEEGAAESDSDSELPAELAGVWWPEWLPPGPTANNNAALAAAPCALCLVHPSALLHFDCRSLPCLRRCCR